MTYKKLLPIISLTLLLSVSSCKEETIPDNIMDTAAMAAFLSEAHLIDSYNSVVVERHADSLQFQTSAALDSLYNKYGINAAVYDSSLAYYIRHPKLLEAIYSRVFHNIQSLNQ